MWWTQFAGLCGTIGHAEEERGGGGGAKEQNTQWDIFYLCI